MKNNIYLCQFNNEYGNNLFLPYSVGLIQAYCQTIEEIQQNFDFKEFLYLREDVDQVSERLEEPKIVGISCYIWNWEHSKALARSIKARHPDCLIVMGGPQVPHQSESFFTENPSVDLLVHFEGELTFAEVLLEYLKDAPDYTRVEGVSVKLDGDLCCRTQDRARLKELELIPSPYTSGLFDDLLSQPYNFNANQETHRGCPYTCTFCDWGFSAFTKVNAFKDERLEAEFKWFGEKAIEFVFNCDANYGILKRDHDLTVKLADTKKKYGYPKQFRACYAKNSNMKIYEIAKILNNAELNKGVTLSMQSMDAHTLDVIKRTNIKVKDLENLLTLYRKENISTYTELILGLPGETYDSFLDGVDELLRAGQHDSLNIYLCMVLPNSEMATPEYVKEHELKTVQQPILLQHSSPIKGSIAELNDIIIETKTLPMKDWKGTYMFSWAVQSMHSLCLAQYIAIFLYFEADVPYRTFYSKLVEFAERNPDTIVGEQFEFVSNLVDETMQGGGWDLVLPKFGEIIWPTEEATFLKVVCEKGRYYAEITEFINQLVEEMALNIDKSLIEDVLTYQQNMVVDPFTSSSFSFEIDHNLNDYFLKACLGERIALIKEHHILHVTEDVEFEGDLVSFAREVVWYGRKGGSFRHTNIIDQKTKEAVDV